jgi:hypothetical protein
MKNIKLDIDDSLRPEYKRSDFGEFVRGAVTQVEFSELVSLLLSCIGEDEGVTFIHHSIGNYLANHRFGDWTYEIDNANQITLRYWLDSGRSIDVNVTNPPCITTPEENAKLQEVLLEGVRELKVKVGNQP